MPEAISITATPEQLAAVKYDAAGLVPVVCQDVHTRTVLMVAHARSTIGWPFLA